MSAIENVLDEAKNVLNEAKKKHRYKKANKARDEAAELQLSLAKCRGQLESSKTELRRTIEAQKRAIAKGKKEHKDTLLQEQMLYDAAIGYMLILDAIYALKTINSYDSIAHAYEMLDAAVDQMKGKKNKLLDSVLPKRVVQRNDYGYITGKHATKEKATLLDSFFEKLKNGADIDLCIEEAYSNNSSDDMAEYAERLKMAEESDFRLEDDMSSLDFSSHS